MQELAVVTPQNDVEVFRLIDDIWEPSAEATRHALWPTSRPGGQWTVSRATTDETALVLGDAAVIEGSNANPPILMGPRLAHYALWSPGGHALSYVVPDGRSLTLKVAWPESGETRVLLSGAPLFPSWLGNTGWLFCHHGSTLSAFNVETGEQRVLSNSASGFRTAACSSDGTLVAWAEVRDGAVHVVAGPLGEEPTEIGRFGGGVALAFRPGTRELVAAVAESPETGVFGEILALDFGAAEPRRVLRGPIVAFWWDPAGERIASLHPTYSGDGRFQVRLHSAEGRFLRATDGFIPSNDTATEVSFFDQYALSHPLWSEDGRWFGAAGRFHKDGPHASFTGGNADVAWVWDTLAGSPVAELGRGQLLVFGRS